MPGPSISSITRSIPRRAALRFAGCLPNPILRQGVRLLSPGMFLRIRLPIGQPHPALLVIDRSIGSDQGLKYVYVVDAEKQGAVSPRDDGRVAGERPARRRERVEAGRVGRRRGDPTGPPADGGPDLMQVPMPTLGASESERRTEPSKRGGSGRGLA